MNIQQRITKLEQVTSPAKDNREPILVKFIGNGDEPTDKAGILMIFRNGACESFNLSTQQLTEYEASEQDDNTEVWLNTVPRPVKATV